MVKKKDFKPKKSPEIEFSRALKNVAKVSSHLVDAHVDGHEIKEPQKMQEALKAYSKAIEPWAQRQAEKMLVQVSKSNKKAYKENSQTIRDNLKVLLADRNVGEVAQALMREQVELIRSIPIRAGERAQKLAMEAATDGTRASEVAQELQKTYEVSESVAMNIAVTEIARSNASLNQARAVAVGSRQYIWRNSGDESVRPAHKRYQGKKLDGMVFSWDDPPTLDDGTKGHPGTFPRCRCYAEPLFED